MAIFDNRYEQEKLLGQGAFSEVWKVKDNQTGVTLALKIYNPTPGADEDGNDMLTHEFALMVNASHKNLLRPLFFAMCGNRPYLILPYCEKGNIGKMIGKMDEDEAWKLLRDTASALAYLHAMTPPILHQDIKPANILLADNGDYMLTDFGVSTQAKQSLSRVSNQDMALFSAGTISYMAPERFTRNNLPIMANDIYSLGSTIYEMLTGFLPFGNDGGLLQKKGAEIPALPEGFSPLLNKTIESCLQEEPWKRPTAVDLEETANRALRHPGTRQFVPENNTPALKETTLQIPSELIEEPSIKATTMEYNRDLLGSGGFDKNPSSKKWYIIGSCAIVLIICALAAVFLFPDKLGISNDQPVVVNTDSLLVAEEMQEYEKCMELFQQDNIDSIHNAFDRMKALAVRGNKDAIFQIAYTYAAIPTDEESVRRKKLMEWSINEDGFLKDQALNKEAIRWLNKSIEVSDSTDYKSLYWLSVYHYYGVSVKEDTKLFLKLLNKAMMEAQKNNDPVFTDKINKTLQDFN
jgi:hypothetical protein